MVHLLGHGDNGYPLVQVKTHRLQCQPFQPGIGLGLGLKHDSIDPAVICPGFNQICCNSVTLCRGGGVAKTAGVRRNTGIQAVGHAFIQGHAHLPDHLVDDLAGSSGTVVQQQPIRIIRVGAVVVNTQINMVLALNGTQQPLGSHIHRHHKPGGELYGHNIVKEIIVLGGNVCLVLHIGKLALLQQRPAKGKATAQSVPVRVGMGQN